MKKQIYIALASLLLITPVLASAQLTQTGNLIERVGELVQISTRVVMALALLFFFWGLAKFIMAGADIEKKTEGKNLMIWGTVALFVMVSIWGLIYWIGNEFLPGISDYSAPPVPTFPVR